MSLSDIQHVAFSSCPLPGPQPDTKVQGNASITVVSWRWWTGSIWPFARGSGSHGGVSRYLREI